MKEHIDNTRRQLGELAAMAHKTQADEKRILERAQELLADVESKIDQARADASAGDEKQQQAYLDMVENRGRLHHVIATAMQALA